MKTLFKKSITVFQKTQIYTWVMPCCLCLLLCLILGCSKNENEIDDYYKSNAQVDYTPWAVEDAYIYPELGHEPPYDSYENRMTAYQLPEDILLKMSTEGLLESCLTYPYRIDLFITYEDYQSSFDYLVHTFNGYPELLKRPDLINVLLRKHRSYDEVWMMMCDSLPSLGLEMGDYSLSHFNLAIIINQDIVFNNLSREQENELFTQFFRRFDMMEECPEQYGTRHYLAIWLLYAKKVLKDSKYKLVGLSDEMEKTLSGFAQNPNYITINYPTIDFLYNYINIKFNRL